MSSAAAGRSSADPSSRLRPRAALLALAAALSVAAAAESIADTHPAVVPNTMLAAAIDKGGGPEVLSIHRLPVPRLQADEVLIALHAAGIGVWEADMRQHPGRARFPLVLGSEGAGTIVAIGSGVHLFKVGDQVYGTGDGFYAEYATARADHIAHIPKAVSPTEAGILAISGLSAIEGIDDALHVQRGDTVIIHGAAGAVGTLAIQFAKLRGAQVLATASNDEGLALARRLGADAVVNGRSGDIAAAAQRFAPQGIDAVLGLAGGDALERCIDTLRRDGRGRVAYLYGMEPLPKPRFGMSMILYSFVSGTRELERLNRFVEQAKLQVPIAAQYPLAAAADAHRRLEAGHVLGKIVLLTH